MEHTEDKFEFRQLLHRYFLAAHPSITDPIERKQCSFIALFHVLGLPLSPSLFILNQSWGDDRVPLGFEWLTLVLGATILSYILLRSPLIKLSFLFQVGIATFLPLFTSYHHPESQGSHFALLIGVILSSIYFGRRMLLIVVAISFVGLATLYPGFSPPHQTLLLESIFILGLTCIIVVMARLFHEWLDLHHLASLKQHFDQFEQLLSASFKALSNFNSSRILA